MFAWEKMNTKKGNGEAATDKFHGESLCMRQRTRKDRRFICMTLQGSRQF